MSVRSKIHRRQSPELNRGTSPHGLEISGLPGVLCKFDPTLHPLSQTSMQDHPGVPYYQGCFFSNGPTYALVAARRLNISLTNYGRSYAGPASMYPTCLLPQLACRLCKTCTLQALRCVTHHASCSFAACCAHSCMPASLPCETCIACKIWSCHMASSAGIAWQ